MNAINSNDVKKGMKFYFKPTGVSFEIAKATATRLSWYTGLEVKSSWGRNNMRMAWVTRKQFQKGIDNGAYILL